MYGRILFIGSSALGEAERMRRLARTCQDGGHAVLTLERSREDGLFARELEAAVKGFSPTIILCEESLDLAMANLSEHAREIPHSTLPAGPFFDERYALTIPSDPSAARAGVSCTQTWSPEREAPLDEALEAAGRTPLVATDPSWPCSLPKRHPYGNPAYHLRTTKYLVAFAGEDFPGEADLSLRVAEGNLVLVEEGTQDDASALSRAFVTFKRNSLAQLVETLEADPNAYDEARARQQKACEALPTARQLMEGVLRVQDEARRQAGETPVLAYEDPATRVTLCGWFGARNFGDDLLMLNAAHRIRQRYPNAQIMVIGARPNVIRRDYGLEAVEPYDRPGLKRVLEGSRALVFCGGLIFDDPLATTSGDLEFLNNPWIEPTGQAGMSLYAAALGVPSVGLGIGAGPVRNEATRRAIRLMGMARMRFLPRDAQTCEWFRLSGVDPALISQKADLILGARSLVEEMAAKAVLPGNLVPGGYFVVSLRTWHLNPPDFTSQIAKAIDRVCAATGLGAVLLPFDDSDVAIHREVMAQAKHPECVTLLQERPGEEEFLSIIAHSAFAFAMRLHCSILHHVLGKPAVGLDYNDKIAAHFKLMGQDTLLIPLDAGSEAMEQAMLAAHERRGCAGDQLSEAVASKATLVDEAFAELFAIIDAGPGDAAGIALHDAELGLSVEYPRTASKEHLKRAKAEAELKACKAERDKLRKQVKKQEAQLNSRTYRAAKAASKTLRPLRKLFRR